MTVETRARYFFLSYPRLRPLPPVPGLDLADSPDEWIRAFHQDLMKAVRGQSVAATLRPGFLDLGTAPAGERAVTLIDALATAEVFVPLLSPEYLRRSWPGCEWASFERRLERAGVADSLQRFAPVLWVPLAAGEKPQGLTAALSLARGAAAGPYEENGLRALMRLSRYRGVYEQIVAGLAARVVSLAEDSPVGPSPAHDPARADSVFADDARGPVFAIAVAGTADGRQAIPLADYAGLAAEQLGFMVVRTEFEKSGEVFRRAPGVLLVDPRSVAGAPGRDELGTRVGELPSWVVPVIVKDESGFRETAEIRTVTEKSYQAHKSQPDPVRRALRGVGSLREFVMLMPFLVSHAEREYLRHGPIQRSASRPAFRPRLAGGRAAPLPVEEKPGV
jgi:hypothetical protein